MQIPFLSPTPTVLLTCNVYAARMGIVSLFLYVDARYIVAIDAGMAPFAARSNRGGCPLTLER